MTYDALVSVLDDVTTHREVWMLWNLIDHASHDEGAMWACLLAHFPMSFADPSDANTIRPVDYYDWPYKWTVVGTAC